LERKVGVFLTLQQRDENLPQLLHWLLAINPQIVVHQQVSECRHPLQIVKKAWWDDSPVKECSKNIRICCGFGVAAVGYDVVADIEQAFNGQMQVAFGCAVYKGIIDEAACRTVSRMPKYSRKRSSRVARTALLTINASLLQLFLEV